jgi:hypothetical protein
LPDDLERCGARCPECRESLYDPPPRRRPRDDDDGRCPVHPDNATLGTCGRCGNYLCDTCRTRWRNRWLCAACVDRALENKEAAPAEASAHLRQALLALALGVVSWAIFFVGLVIAGAGVEGGGKGLVVVAGLVILGSPLPAVGGVGQGAAAVRARGDHMILATIGLVLSGLNVGAFIGLLSFGIGLQV